MSQLHHLSKGQLDKNKIQLLKFVLNKMIKSAPLHIRLPIHIIEFMVLIFCLIRFQKLISNLDELEITEKKEEEILTEDQIDDKVQKFGEYDPKLDLSRYELPNIDLLEARGTSGASEINKEELRPIRTRL